MSWASDSSALRRAARSCASRSRTSATRWRAASTSAPERRSSKPWKAARSTWWSRRQLGVGQLGTERFPLCLGLLGPLAQSRELVLQRHALALERGTGLERLLGFLLQPAHHVALVGEALAHTLLVLGARTQFGLEPRMLRIGITALDHCGLVFHRGLRGAGLHLAPLIAGAEAAGGGIAETLGRHVEVALEPPSSTRTEARREETSVRSASAA